MRTEQERRTCTYLCDSAQLRSQFVRERLCRNEREEAREGEEWEMEKKHKQKDRDRRRSGRGKNIIRGQQLENLGHFHLKII